MLRRGGGGKPDFFHQIAADTGIPSAKDIDDLNPRRVAERLGQSSNADIVKDLGLRGPRDADCGSGCGQSGGMIVHFRSFFVE